ncbi:hypothetical protein KM043_016399 [Ampulex compressa]|nr:hypothetical protein KM043_016399 [Ampulex compressa]
MVRSYLTIDISANLRQNLEITMLEEIELTSRETILMRANLDKSKESLGVPTGLRARVTCNQSNVNSNSKKCISRCSSQCKKARPHWRNFRLPSQAPRSQKIEFPPVGGRVADRAVTSFEAMPLRPELSWVGCSREERKKPEPP